AAHAHRQRVEPRAPGVELIAELAKLREPGALARRLGLLGWNAHQTAQREARQRRDCRGEGAKPPGRDAALGGPARQVHLPAAAPRSGTGCALPMARSVTDCALLPAAPAARATRSCTAAMRAGKFCGLINIWDVGPLRYTSGARPGADLHAALASSGCACLTEYQWPSISRNCSPSPSRTTRPTCICPRACRR